MAKSINKEKDLKKDAQDNKKNGLNSGLKLLLIGVVSYLLGVFVIVGGLIHDLLILGGAIVFVVGLVSLITNRKKKK